MARRGVAREQTSVKLGDDQMQEFKAAFQLFSGGKETLNVENLDKSLKKFGIKNANAKDMIKEADSNNEGQIDFLAFANLMSRKMAESDTEDDLRDAFEKFDWGRKGEIMAKELGEALTNLGKPITTRELQEFLNLTQNGDVILYNKFINELYSKTPEDAKK